MGAEPEIGVGTRVVHRLHGPGVVAAIDLKGELLMHGIADELRAGIPEKTHDCVQTQITWTIQSV